jgi:hypothetical protein
MTYVFTAKDVRVQRGAAMRDLERAYAAVDRAKEALVDAENYVLQCHRKVREIDERLWPLEHPGESAS